MPGSDVGNQGLSGRVMLIPSFVGPDPEQTLAKRPRCFATFAATLLSLFVGGAGAVL